MKQAIDRTDGSAAPPCVSCTCELLLFYEQEKKLESDADKWRKKLIKAAGRGAKRHPIPLLFQKRARETK